MTLDALHLEVPDILHDSELSPTELNQRLTELEQLPADETLQQALAWLSTLNRSALTLLQRQRVLQSVCEHYQHYSHNLDLERFPQPSFVQLCKELAIGFKRLLLQILQGKQPSRPHLAWCLYMANYFLSQSQLRHYQLYLEPPPSLWSDCHLLHWIAEHQGCLDEPVASAFQPSASPTLRGLYQQMLIMALSNPFHLSEGQCLTLFNALTPLAELARVVPWEADDDSENPLLDLSQPLSCLPVDHLAGSNNQYLRRLELGPLLVALNEYSPLQSQQQHDLLLKVSQHWNNRQLRRHPRNEHNSECQLVLGIANIHAHLLEKRPGHVQGQILDISPGGARLLCPLELVQQLMVGQIALVLTFSSTPCLALIRWRHINQQGIHLGLRYLKGLPRAAWLRRAPSASTQAGVLQSTPEPGAGWHHGLWLADGQFVEGENIWLQMANTHNQTVISLPAANLHTSTVARYPLRLA